VETFVDGVSGVAAASTDAADLADAVRRAASLPAFEARDATARFDEPAFQGSIERFLRKT